MTKAHLLPAIILGIFAWLLLSWAGRYGSAVVLAAVGALLLVQYWLGPVLIWATNRSRVPVWETPAATGFESVPDEVRSFFASADGAFVELGFTLVAVLREKDLTPGYSTYFALYSRKETKERAGAHAHIPADPLAVIKVKPSIYFTTKFLDARRVETANSSHVDVFPPIPGKEVWQFPEIEDPTVLYRIHQILSAPLARVTRAFPAEGEEIAEVAKGMAEFYGLHVGTGYLRVLEPGLVFGPTAKGALLMTWKLLPPWSWLSNRRRKQMNATFFAEHRIVAA